MKVLFCCQPAVGHFHPMVPLARALEETGHEPVFVTSESFRPWIERAGFASVAAGTDWLESAVEEAFPEVGEPATWDGDGPWLRAFGRAGHAMSTDLVALLGLLKPAVVIHESGEGVAPFAAAAAGVPCAALGIMHRKPIPMMAQQIKDGLAAMGITDGPEVTPIAPALYLDAYPASMQPFPAEQFVPPSHPVRPEPFEVTFDEPPTWLSQVERPAVYVTMGTVFNRVPGAFGAVLEGLRQTDLDVVVTVGDSVDPRDVGVQPPKIRVERYVAQSCVLPRVDLVVTHGGYNTMVAALTHGLPMLCLPLGADQPYNAFRLQAAGAAISLDARGATPVDISAAVQELLNNPQYKQNARRLCKEIDSMPPVGEALRLVEQLARR